MDKPQDYQVAYIVDDPNKQPLSPLDFLNQLVTSEEGIKMFVERLYQEVDAGRLEALKVKVFTKSLKEIQESTDERLREHYVSEAQKHGDKPFPYSGTVMRVGEVGGRFDYTKCGHPGWDLLEKQRVEVVRQQKEYEEIMKVNKAPFMVEYDKELFQVSPPVKVGAKMSVITSIK
jgi:hypothetical protein